MAAPDDALNSAERFEMGMRHVPGAVSIVSTMHNGVRRGMTMTAVCSILAEPPTLLIGVNRSASAHDLITASGCFAVNQLKCGHNEAADLFAGRRGIDGDMRFVDTHWFRARTGAPILIDSFASFDCRVVQTVAAETHSLFIGRVEQVFFDGASDDPLVYLRGKYNGVCELM